MASPSTDPARRPSQPAASPNKDDTQGYRLLVGLDRSSLRTEDAEVPLRPGMTVQVDIATGKRRIIALLLDLIQKHLREAGRER